MFSENLAQRTARESLEPDAALLAEQMQATYEAAFRAVQGWPRFDPRLRTQRAAILEMAKTAKVADRIKLYQAGIDLFTWYAGAADDNERRRLAYGGGIMKPPGPAKLPPAPPPVAAKPLNVAAFLADLRQRGIALTLRGDDQLVAQPSQGLTGRDRATVREHRAAIRNWLESSAEVL